MLGKNAQPSHILPQLKWPIAMYCLPLIWALLQVVPDIGSQMVNPVWSLASNVLQIKLPKFISTSPYDTVTAFMRLLAYGLVFLMSAHYCQDSKNANTLFNWVAFAGFCYASYALIVFFGGYKSVLWYDKLEYREADVSSTFINRNTYATYAGLAILCCMSKFYETMQLCAFHGFKSNFGKQYFIEKLITQGWYIIINLIISITALLLTQSRGGCFSALVGVVGLFVLLSVYKQIKLNAYTYLSIGLLLFILAMVQISGDNLMNRIDALDSLSDGRFKVYDILMQAIANNPWYGMGYGTFENSFRLFRTEEISWHINFAHNTYLENLFELGLGQALLLFTAIALLALQFLKGIKMRKKNILFPAVGFSATMLVACHSFMDFSLQIPAIAVTYAAIMGAAFAQSFSNRDHSKNLILPRSSGHSAKRVFSATEVINERKNKINRSNSPEKLYRSV